MPTNDNDPPREAIDSAPDPHGQAALLLVESLIHALCENATLSNEEAVDIVERAASVQSDVANAADGAAPPMWRSYGLLTSIATSLRAGEAGPRAGN